MTLEPATVADIRSIRARAYAIIRAAGIEIAHSYRSAIRGMRNWSGGVTIEEWRFDTIQVVSRYDRREAAGRYVARAVAALREAGWTVDDDGTIREVPVKGER